MPGFAAGATTIPNDMIVQVHQGETIIPRPFAEGLRAGELSLSKGGKGGGSVINITVPIHVEGSVLAEEDLSKKIAKRIERTLERGYA